MQKHVAKYILSLGLLLGLNLSISPVFAQEQSAVANKDMANNAIKNNARANKTEPVLGEYKGAKTAKHPAWFKESFLDFSEDVDEATAAGKRLVLYFYQAGCPYCNQLWEHNMAVEGIEAEFQSKFDVVAINLWGDQDVITVGGKAFTEKELARALDVDFTPSLQFYDEQKKPALRLNGYLPPNRFKLALAYAAGDHPEGVSFNDFANDATLIKNKENGITSGSTLARTAAFFQSKRALRDRSAQPALRPLAVLFETPDCPTCERFHDITLQHKDTRAALEKMDVVQLNAQSAALVSTPDGGIVPIKQWANELGLAYYPSMVFFDEKGEQVMLMNAKFHNFHTQSIFTYVNEKAYLKEPSFQRYISARADAFIEQGIDVDIWEE